MDLQKLCVLRTEDGSVDYECIITSEDGVPSSVLAHTEVITTPEGKHTVYTTFLDVSENESLKSEKRILNTLCQDYIAVMGYRLIDDIIAQEEQKKSQLREVNAQLEEQLHTISGLSNAFFAVYWVDMRTNLCKALKNIPFFEQAVSDCLTTDDVTDTFLRLCVRLED